MDKILKLEQALQNGKLSHALIFECADNAGIEVARYFTELFRAFLCTERATKPCGRCESCTIPLGLGENDQRQHPDFFFARPAAESGYTVDQVRDWGGQFLYLSRNISPCKVLVVSNAEKLSGSNQGPANALLKILEEPRAECFLILLTSKPYRLLSTVRSRCLKISFKNETRGTEPAPAGEQPLIDELLSLFVAVPATRSQLSAPSWWKDRAARIAELEVCHAKLWILLKERVVRLTREETLLVWHKWKHFEDFLTAVKLYGNPPLHWLNLKRKVKGEHPWRISKLFG